MLQAAFRFLFPPPGVDIAVQIRLAIGEQRTDSHRQWVIYNHCGHHWVNIQEKAANSKQIPTASGQDGSMFRPNVNKVPTASGW